MTFSTFCTFLSRIEKTTLRLEMTRTLAELFNQLNEDEIEPACWLLLGRLVPKFEDVEFHFAEKMMARAVASLLPESSTREQQKEQMSLLAPENEVNETRLAVVMKEFKKAGDFGNAAVTLGVFLQKDSRSLHAVYDELYRIATESGEGSQDRKLQRVIEILRASDEQTGKYLTRILVGTLRLGFSDMTVLDALSWAKTGDKSVREQLELAYQKNTDVGALARAYLTRGIEGLDAIHVKLGVPLFPALCQRLKTADEMIEKMGKVYVEPKYDGTRVMIHLRKNSQHEKIAPTEKNTNTNEETKHTQWRVRTFTRNLEETSGMFPELLTTKAFDAVHADEIILDSEAVGYDTVTGKLLPFQQTIQRKRKHDIAETAARVPLRFFVFDILYINGRGLLQKPLHERKKLLEQTVDDGEVFVKSPYIVTEDAKTLRDYHAAQLAEGLEGAVIKQYASEYQPGRRGWSWVKFKEEEGTTGKLSDTIDCVVMGYYTGQGKRTKFGVGAFLVGVVDASTGKTKTIAKIGTGLVDDQWRELFTRCSALAVDEKPEEYDVPKDLRPDIWSRPELVVEIAADNITISPLHSAGVALRFPRLVKFRDDKSAQQATTVQEVRGMGEN